MAGGFAAVVGGSDSLGAGGGPVISGPVGSTMTGKQVGEPVVSSGGAVVLQGAAVMGDQRSGKAGGGVLGRLDHVVRGGAPVQVPATDLIDPLSDLAGSVGDEPLDVGNLVDDFGVAIGHGDPFGP